MVLKYSKLRYFFSYDLYINYKHVIFKITLQVFEIS